MVLFVFQYYPVCNFAKFISFGLGNVSSERVKPIINNNIGRMVVINPHVPIVFALQSNFSFYYQLLICQRGLGLYNAEFMNAFSRYFINFCGKKRRIRVLKSRFSQFRGVNCPKHYKERVLTCKMVHLPLRCRKRTHTEQ